MKYRWHDGFEFEAANDAQVVTRLRADATWPEGTFDKYKRALAFRAGEFAGKEIRFCSPETLVADLIEHGLMQRIA